MFVRGRLWRLDAFVFLLLVITTESVSTVQLAMSPPVADLQGLSQSSVRQYPTWSAIPQSRQPSRPSWRLQPPWLWHLCQPAGLKGLALPDQPATTKSTQQQCSTLHIALMTAVSPIAFSSGHFSQDYTAQDGLECLAYRRRCKSISFSCELHACCTATSMLRVEQQCVRLPQMVHML